MAGPGLSRRQALAAGGAAALAAGRSGRAQTGAPPAFLHGVASGDPLQDRVILWTRVTTEGGQPVELRWTLARDEALTDIAARGTVTATPAADWTAKVDAAGLAPGTRYYYAFEAGGVRSPVGRTQTLPEGPVGRFEIAVASCSNYPAGRFHLYRDIAERDVDLVLHLGDYFYEYGAGGWATDWGMENGRAPIPEHETVTLADYRARHAQYKSDPDLQAAHASAPWITIWDDHESANNAHRDGAQNHQPEDEGDWPARRTASVRAYFEWLPIREPELGRAREGIWRSFEIGDLATLVMLETRLTARSREITWDEAPIPPDADPDVPANRAAIDAFLSDTVGAPEREMLGEAQAADVAEALGRSVAAGKPWQVLGNQVIMAQVFSPDYVATLPAWFKWIVQRRYPYEYSLLQRSRFRIPLNLDQWDGFPAARERLYAAAREAGAQLLTVTGDTHCFYVNRLTDAQGEGRGVEFGTSSITSPSEYNEILAPGVNFGRLTEEANADVLHHNAYDRGYVALTLTPEKATAELRRTDTITRERYRIEPYARWEVVKSADGALEIARV